MRSTGRVCVARDLALAVERAAQRIHDAAEQRRADRDLDDAARGPDLVALLDGGGVAQDDRADRLLLEVEGHAHHPAGELEQLGHQGGVQAVDLGDAVADLDDGPDAAGLGASRRSRSIWLLMMLMISSDRMAIASPFGRSQAPVRAGWAGDAGGG